MGHPCSGLVGASRSGRSQRGGVGTGDTPGILDSSTLEPGGFGWGPLGGVVSLEEWLGGLGPLGDSGGGTRDPNSCEVVTRDIVFG